jgi:hypothetical protein
MLKLKLNMWQIQQALHQQLVGFICEDIAMSSNRNASATSSTGCCCYVIRSCKFL